MFFLKGLNLSLVEIGSLNKIISIVSTIIGAFVGGIILSKINIYKSLLIFGVLQALSNLLFIPLSMFEIQKFNNNFFYNYHRKLLQRNGNCCFCGSNYANM